MLSNIRFQTLLSYIGTSDNPRAYTTKFGESLLKAYELWRGLPSSDRPDVRARRAVDLSKSDREIFAGLDTGDLWLDGRVHECFLYLHGSSNCQLLCRI